MHEAAVFEGTAVFDTLTGLNAVYKQIEKDQSVWKNASCVSCPDGCGTCCVDFEPDVFEAEAVYAAAWLLHNDPERAKSIMDGSYISPRAKAGEIYTGKGCFLFDEENPYHCTIYGGRTLICRLFGFSGDRGKDSLPRWKPCRFNPDDKLPPGVTHRQYSSAEMEKMFGALPPVMSDIVAQAASLQPDETCRTVPLRDALPAALRKLSLLMQFIAPPEPNSPSPDCPNPTTPVAA